MKNQRYNSINKTVVRGKKLCLYMLLLMVGALSSQVYAQANCSVNAGGNTTICGTTHTLNATRSGMTVGDPTWTIQSKPAGADDPVIEEPNSLTTEVTGLNSPGAYVFQVSQPCTAGTGTSTVTITAPGDVATFTAGPDITDVSAINGEVTLNAVVPDGYTIQWSAYNIYRWERSAIRTDQNSQFDDPTSATPTFSLINKANHEIDPAYVVTARITSTLNPNCWYEDTAIVRFIPNPEIVLPSLYATCFASGSPNNNFIQLSATSPIFSKDYSGSPGSSGNFGTTVTLNVISQPVGGNIQYVDIWDNRVFFTGIDVVGDYVFTLTVENDNGSYTTGHITYRFNGFTPNHPTFLVASRPEQMILWSGGSSGGEFHCNYAGQTTPITVYFDLHADDPLTLTTNVSNAGTAPPGGAPTLSAVSGTGTANRSVTVTPPAGGWRVGTYRLSLNTGNGSCNVTQSYYIHISDGNRPDVHVDDITVCYPGSGVVTATVPLPDVYKQVVNSSYFQGFNTGRYDLEVISRPAGSAVPTFAPQTSRTIEHTSTTINNLNRAGEYVFKIKVAWHATVANFLEQEYACSDAAMEHTFSIFVSEQVGANAGSDLDISVCQPEVALNGNNPGVASNGVWTLVNKPAGVPDPVIEDPTLYNTDVTGFIEAGTYTFEWTISTGDCTSSDQVDVTVDFLCPFTCDASMYLAQSGASTNTTLYGIETSSNPFTYPAIGAIASTKYNAMGFNPIDGFIYAMKENANEMLKIGENGAYANLGAITGLPVGYYNSGEIDDSGNFYVTAMGPTSTMYRIDIENRTATAIPLTGSVPIDPSDLAYNVNTELLYGVNNGGRMISVNPATGEVLLIGDPGVGAPFGAMMGSSTGGIFGVSNNGGFYQFDITNGNRVKISDSPTSAGNDGAHCVTAPITFEADLAVTKTDNSSSYMPGTTTTYTIVVTNNGPFGVLDAHVQDPVPAGIPETNVSYSVTDASEGSTSSVTGTQIGAIDDYVALPPGGYIEYTVTFAIPVSFTGDLVNTVTITPPIDSEDPDMTNNTATDINLIDDTADIAVHKVGPISAEQGSEISYEIHVSNNGFVEVTDVVVTDPEVDHFTVTNVTCEAGDGTGGTAGCPTSVTIAELQGSGLVIPSMPAGSAVVFTVTGTVGDTPETVIVNTATVAYANDSNPDNNSSTVETFIYKCLTDESTYTIDAQATLTLPANVINPDGGTLELVYTLTSGDPVPGIGTEFTQTFTYSALNNHFGVENQWEELGTGGPLSNHLVLSPKTAPDVNVPPTGVGSLYDDLPANNSTDETVLASNNQADNIFTTKIANGELDELGRFTISVGDFPVAPAGYISSVSKFTIYANGNRTVSTGENRAGFWMKPLAVAGVRDSGNSDTERLNVVPGETIEWRYSAFSNGTAFSTSYPGDPTNLRGVTLLFDNSITFAKSSTNCDVVIITNPMLINQVRKSN